MDVALTTASDIIILEGEGGGAFGVGFLGLIDQADKNNLDAGDGSDDGEWSLFFDWMAAPDLLENLKLRVIRSSALGR